MGVKWRLTDLQKAYVMGERDGFLLGGNSAQVYFSCKIKDFRRQHFENALETVVRKHRLLYSFINNQQMWEEKEFDTVPIQYGKCEWQIDVCTFPLFHIEVTENGENASIDFWMSGLLMDGWSVNIFLEQLKDAYQGTELKDAADYLEYIESVKAYQADFRYIEDDNFYREWIEKYPPEPLMLPYKIDPNQVKCCHYKNRKKFLEKETLTAITECCNQVGITPFVYLMTVFSYVLERYSGSNRFYLNVPCGVRDTRIKNLENSIGLFSNFIIFPVNIDWKQSILENALRNQDMMLELQEHIFYPGTKVLQKIREKYQQILAAPVVFTSMLDLENLPVGDFCLRDWSVHTNQVTMETDLLWLDGKPVLSVDYVEELFEEDLIDSFIDTFIENIESMVLYQPEIELCTADWGIIKSFNDTKRITVQEPLAVMLAANFIKYANKTAAIYQNRIYRYEEIFQMSIAVEKAAKKKVQKEKMAIGIFLPKGIMQIVSAVGAVLGGHIYMPIEQSLSLFQIQSCVEHAELDLIITDEKNAEKMKIFPCLLIESIEIDVSTEHFRMKKSSPEDIRIFINTSGTTGTPKTIALRETAIVNCLADTNEKFGIESEDCVFAITNFCHDMAIFDTFGMFLCGGSILIPEEEKSRDPFYWMELIKKYPVTIWNSVPSFMEILMLSGVLETKSNTIPLRRIILGGEFLNPQLSQQIFTYFPNVHLYNVGGPTETTIWNICHRVDPKESGEIPYGRPFPNTQYYVLNKKRECCPIGVTGIMYCQGNGVADGYVGAEEETSQRFFQWGGQRGYSTGDLGQLSFQGEMMILGRDDFQVKIHGKRIELSGIESALRRIDGIKSALVIYIKKMEQLAAFYIGDSELKVDMLKDYLVQELASYMVPKYFIPLSVIPLTVNGKPDRKLLEETVLRAADMQKEKMVKDETSDHLTSELRSLLRDVLEEDVVLEDNFYTLGGDSLSAVKISANLYRKYQVEIPVYEILNVETIRQWIDLVKEKIERNKKDL